MAVEVELDIFSGRPNPRWLLSSRNEAEFFERINSLAAASPDSFPEPPGIGYRGFLLKVIDRGVENNIRAYKGWVKIADEIKSDASGTLEEWLFKTADSTDIELLNAVRNELPF